MGDYYSYDERKTQGRFDRMDHFMNGLKEVKVVEVKLKPEWVPHDRILLWKEFHKMEAGGEIGGTSTSSDPTCTILQWCAIPGWAVTTDEKMAKSGRRWTDREADMRGTPWVFT